MKKIFLSVIYALLIIGFLYLFFFVISAKIDHYFFSYEPTIYKHEIDSLFQPQFIKHIKVKYVYKAGKRGSVYYIKCDSLSNIAVIEATNYQNVNINNIQILSADKINVTQDKTYVAIVNQPFPLIEQILNPKKSNFLAITFEKPFQIENTIKNSRYCYLKGSYSFIASGNTQNIDIVSFRKKDNNEILIFQNNGKLYFVIQTLVKVSLLDIIKIPE
jgi:hypothetical protein